MYAHVHGDNGMRCYLPTVLYLERYQAHRALELLEDYHAKLTRPQDKQLRLAIERVIRIFKSRLFQALLEPVSREWPLISSWYITVLITLGYIYFIFIVGPHYMKNRPPYKLKVFMLFYNSFQILANAWLVKEHISAGWFWKYGLTCMPPEVDTPNALKLTNTMWWVLILKLIDYIETCLFVLRKKDNQVSTLHVYHHLSNVAFGWYYLRYVSDHRATFLTLLNCNVHVIMYVYYWIAAYSPKHQRMIFFIKPFITRIQMIQFVAMLLYMLQAAMPGCEISKSALKLIPFVTINLIIFLYLFYDFYTKNFSQLPKQKSV